MSIPNLRTALLILLLGISVSTKSVASQIGGDFNLTDHHGAKYSLAQDRGKFVLLFFGYTTCPDICPGTLNHVASVFKQLGEYSGQYKGLFITVDPERDTLQKLASYVPWFGENLTGLTGSQEEIDQVVKQYNARYKILKSPDNSDDYFVDHSADLYLIGADGTLEAVIPFGLPVEHTVRVLKSRLLSIKDDSSLVVHYQESVDDEQAPVPIEAALQMRSGIGKPLLLNFWASWCEPCRAEIPSLNDSYLTHQNLPLEMLAVNVGETRQAVQSFLKKHPIEFPVALDTDGKSFDLWHLKGLPATLVFNAQGSEVLRILGERDWASAEMLQTVQRAVLE